ncbi:MAG: protein jag [Anaerolineae bacterium]|nr:protein jag [Anaerolineae bacterium]
MQKERKSVESSGRSVDDALVRALEELGVDRDQVEVEILTEGSRGLLGLGAEQARVRVTAIEPEGYPSEEQVAEEPGPAGEGVGELAAEALRDLLRQMGIEARVRVREPYEDKTSPLVLDVEGDDLGILIGRQGETLRDLQYITRLIVSRKAQRWVNLFVDVGGYKRRREGVLTELAQRMAERAIAEQRAIPLEPMPPHERRIVHLALVDHELVTTESTGEGQRRKVIIFPKR